jgi:hypothetical protein
LHKFDRLPNEATDLDVFVKVACHLAKGGLMNVIGREIIQSRKSQICKLRYQMMAVRSKEM